ncbi:MAG: hypothetical protein GAK30_03638 [Paracidovorax wautersii]|uniref:Heparan-alpha-glucosaminide N-acetyltransferase catalytic domain-containing protein n=1 Tax=Paracidovorax wautersii TaxID=1177982 RepID=A0A7V8FKP6_9BURK|nr:MAG: hypothetical protein GAK30_03638 [Paracidovorax wautersii]
MSSSLSGAALPRARPLASLRLQSIDALRGLVIVFMLLDHVRETFFLHAQVSDPMDVAATDPALFFSRLLAHVCAPVFVFLTGLSAFLYGTRQADGRAATSAFLLKRGLFLIVLEFTLINFAWTFQLPPQVIYLQVIWAIGLSMVALAGLVWLPRGVLTALGLAIVAGHNLLDGLHFPVGDVLHLPWAVLHDRGWIEVSETLRMRTSYPVLPWIGVIALGYAAGPWFGGATPPAARQRLLARSGLALLAGFVLLRSINVYGDRPWAAGESVLATLMSFVNVTKYPPSLLFLMLTLGIGLLLLLVFERQQQRHGGFLPPALAWLKVFGSAPMFFYLLHLYVLKLLYLTAVTIWGLNQGRFFGFDSIGAVWLVMVILTALLYAPVKAFAGVKTRRRDIAWLKYL